MPNLENSDRGCSHIIYLKPRTRDSQPMAIDVRRLFGQDMEIITQPRAGGLKKPSMEI